MKKFLFFLLVLAPLVDYLYKIKFIEIAGLQLSPNKIYKLIPIFLLIFLLFLSPRKLFLWRFYILLLIITFLSVVINFGNHFSETLDVWFRFISSFIFIVLCGKIFNIYDIKKIFKALTFISILPILISFLQFFEVVPYSYFDYIEGNLVGRVSGGYLSPVAMVSYLIYTFAYIVSIFLTTRKLFLKLISFIYLLLIYLTILLTYHRASLLIFVLIFLILLYSGKKSKQGLIFLLVFCFMIIIFNLEFILKLYIPSFSVSEVGVEGLLRGRMGVWITYLSEFINSDILHILFGRSNAVISSNLLPYFFPEDFFNEPHNDLVRLIYQYGIVGFIFYFTIFVKFFQSISEFLKKSRNKDERTLGNIAFAIGVSLILYSITIEPSRYPSFFWYYSTIMSYILVRVNKNDELLKTFN
jgi:hypothetical protein